MMAIILVSLLAIVLLVALLHSTHRNMRLLVNIAHAHREAGSASELTQSWRREAQAALEEQRKAQTEERKLRDQLGKLYERMVALKHDRPLVERPDGQFEEDATDPPSVRQADRAVTESQRIKARPINEIESDREPLTVNDRGDGEDEEDDGA